MIYTGLCDEAAGFAGGGMEGGVPPSTVSKKIKNEAPIGGILRVCKVNMEYGGGGKRGSNLKFLKKKDPNIFS